MTGLYLLCLFGLLLLPLTGRAQVVADGQTNILDGITTNLTSDISIGTNGSFTLLVITDGATVTNTSGNCFIGNNASAQSNRVVVTGAGSVWSAGSGDFIIGDSGSYSELDILNGGSVVDAYGAVGYASSSRDNLVMVSDPGSLWQSTDVYVGLSLFGGTNNQLIVTNGGMVASSLTVIGPGNGGNNAAWVTGNNSVWTNSGQFTVGGYGSRGLLVLTNGGKLFSANTTVGGMTTAVTNETAIITGAGSSWSSGYFYLGYMSGIGNQVSINNGGALTTSSTFDIGVYSSSNHLTLTDPGSSLQCQIFRIGYSSTANQCAVSNGATLSVNLSIQPTTIEGTLTTTTVSGPGSVWTNAGDLHFGQYSNVLSILNGGTMVDNIGYIENGSGKPNTVIVAGTNSLWRNFGDLHVADLGSQMLVTNGGMVVDGTGYLGDNAGNNNCYVLVSGSGSVWSNNNLYVGNNGTSNQLVVANGGTLDAGVLNIGNTSNSANNSLIVNGGSLIVAYDGPTISGTLSDLSGTLTLNSGLISCIIFDLALNAGPTNRFNFNGGTLQALTLNIKNGLPLIVGDGIHAATLDLLGGACGSPQGLIISSNAVFTGARTVRANVLVGRGGTFAPGYTNILSLTVYGGLTLSSGSTTVMGLSPGSGNGNNVLGLTNVVYGGTLQLTNLGGTYAGGQSFALFSSSNYSGAFNNLLPAIPGPSLRWDTYALTVDGVLRIFSTPTPPPAASAVLQADGRLVVAATAGIPYDPCYLLTSTNLTTPFSSWSSVATNCFDVTGATSFTNVITTGESQRYFQLQVN